VFESVGTGLIALDRSHTITTFNRRDDDHRRAGDGGARRPWHALFGDLVSLPAIEADLATEPDNPSRHEAVLPRPGGSSVPVRLTFWALKAGDEDEQLGVICACEDLTAARAMEERLRQADRLATLGRMSANIAHEIRNPLASLTGASRSSPAAGRPARCASGSRRSSSRNPGASARSCAPSSNTPARRRWCGRA